jgi:hypothetical protein
MAQYHLKMMGFVKGILALHWKKAETAVESDD